jgi:16S rRNA (guanine1207-N2)-methyltransferase
MRVNACDIVYGVNGAGHRPSGALVVDYDVRRLRTVGPDGTRCAELADLVAEGWHSLDRICLNLFPFTSRPQWQRDIDAAARLLDVTGEVVVRVPESKLCASVGRILRARFGLVERQGRTGFRCALPRAGASPPQEEKKIQHQDPVSGRALHFTTAPGLFSAGVIDPGTLLLLRALGERSGGVAGRSVLDMGCGYGALGCILAARGATTTLIDSDWRAVKLSRANLAANGLAGEVVVGDAAHSLPAGRFDLVVSNPPTHAGSAVLQRLFENAAAAGVAVVIVVRAQLNYEKWLTPRYRIDRLAAENGYKVLAFTGAAGIRDCR